MTDTATQLADAKQAYHDLVTGNKPVSMMRAGRSITFQPAQRQELLAYIQDLERQLQPEGASSRRALRVSYHV